MCIITQYSIFFLCGFYSGLSVYKKHNLPPLARIKAFCSFPLPPSYKFLLQVWLCPMGEVGNHVFAQWCPFLKGAWDSHGFCFHCHWSLAGWYSCFDLNPWQLLWKWLSRTRSCLKPFPLNIKQCYNLRLSWLSNKCVGGQPHPTETFLS